jgi:transposase InsO family protein
MINETERAGSMYRVEDICLVHELTRQAYYQWKKRETKQSYQEEIVIQLIQEKRKRQPKIGGRKLHQILKNKFKKSGFKIGRDRLFNILLSNGLLVQNKKKYIRTTDSNHLFRIYKNLIKGITVDKTNQVLVADITYIDTREGFVYLAILTDVYSRKILGYNVSKSLSVAGSLLALSMSLKGIKNPEGMIHHSDRGIQYCCNEYTRRLKDKGIKISMAEKGNPYENAIAERVNGILKIEFLLDQKFRTKKDAIASVKESIQIYNEERPHMSLNYLTPSEKPKGKKAA